MFLYCPERLYEGTVYPRTIKLPEKWIEMGGKVIWSNLDTCTSLNLNPAMSFYFMRIDEDKDKQVLRAAIEAEGRKLPHLKHEVDRRTDSFLFGQGEPEAHVDEFEGNTR
jgi:hypothetical protein